MTGALITMEGVEGSGKSTQIARLSERLKGKGLPVVLSKEPGGTALGRELRRLLLSHHESGEVWCPESELLLFYADRAQHLSALVKPALAQGALVLVDRFEDSSWAYQGARGVPDGHLERLRDLVLGAFRPDLTVVLDLDPEASLARVHARNGAMGQAFLETRFDEETLGFHQRVRERFLALARREPGRIALVSAEGDVDAVEARIWERVAPLLRDRGWMDV